MLMSYTAFGFYVFLTALLILYYIMPLRARWIVLLAGSGAFYYINAGAGIWALLFTILLSYGSARLLESSYAGQKQIRGLVLAITVILIVSAWFLLKYDRNILGSGLAQNDIALIAAPLGISFYTLQIIAYLVDIYRGADCPKTNLKK